jgi:hypothetical protein
MWRSAAEGRPVVFCGPTLGVCDARRELDVLVLPPAARGDVATAVLAGASMVGLVDGWFDRMPSVLHKEILWALARGVPVFGAASMGALRAAELADFGMVGVGWIYEAYHAGGLSDDDEVAVMQGPEPEDGAYQTLSEPLVNIRRTIRSAVQQGVISAQTASTLEELSKQRFYSERTLPRTVADGREAGLPEAELARFEQWLPEGRVDQKREDTLAMLRAMRRAGDRGQRVAPKFTLEMTEDLRRLLADAAARLQPPSHVAADPVAALAAFRIERALLTEAQISMWLALHDLTEADLVRILSGQAALSRPAGPTHYAWRVSD